MLDHFQQRKAGFRRDWRTLATILALGGLTACGSAPPAKAPSAVAAAGADRQQVRAELGKGGMVVSDAPLASQVGAAVLRRGGSAADAAVATAFALAVVLPSAGNLGGGGFVVLHQNGETTTLDFRETAPAAAHRDMFLDAAGNPTDASVTGHRAAGVPGSVAGLWELHHKYGRLPWAELVAPAIELAEKGFPVDADFATFVGQEAARLALYPASAALFLPGGRPLEAGAIFRSAELAATLRRIAEKGRDGFYLGTTADLLIAESDRGGGILKHQDLAAYEVKWREPILFEYRGLKVASMPPPSSGGVALAMIAQQLEPYELSALGHHSVTAIHLQAEAMRRAFAVRNEALGDPDFLEVPTTKIASKEFAQQLGASISLSRATPSAEVSGRQGIVDEGPHTTHFSVADADGNAVAMTTTLNFSFGSAVTVEGAGFLLNDEMDDFASKPGAPNQFGLVQGEANAIAPGKRMLSSMTPTIAFGKDGKPVLVTGASGGPFIITTTFQILSALADFQLGAAAAMKAPRFHHQHLPDRLELEKDGFPPETRQMLENMGHQLVYFDVPMSGWTIAATIIRGPQGFEGMADPRIHGLAAGF